MTKICKERKQLLPTWIRFFSWIFLVFLATPIAFIVAIFMGDIHYDFYGISYYGPILHPLPIAIVIVMTLHGIAAYGLLWGRRWGVDVAISCGFIAAALSIVDMIRGFGGGKIHFNFLIIAQWIFLMTLFDIRKEWLAIQENKPAQQSATKGTRKPHPKR